MVDAEPAQRGVEGADQVAARGVRLPAAAAAADPGLGGDDQVVALHDVADQRADQLLRGALAVPGGGVDERAAGLGEGDELVAGLVLVGVAAPGERAEPQPGDLEAGATQVALLHGQRYRDGSRHAHASPYASPYARPTTRWPGRRHPARQVDLRSLCEARTRPAGRADGLLSGSHPRHRRGADRVPPGVQHRPPDDRRAAARACRWTTRPSRRSPRSSRSARSPRWSSTSGRDIWRIARAWAVGLVKPELRGKLDHRMGWYIIVGSIPIGVVGLLAKDLITGPLRSLWVVGIALILWSGVMLFAEQRGRQERREKDLTLRDAVIVGLVQCVALVPGVSRSGATISAGLLRRARPGRRDPAVVLPVHPGAGRGGALRAQGRALAATSASARPSSARWSASWSPTPRSPGC